MCPTVAKWGCGISAHGLHGRLQTAITFSFQIQIKNRLKLWTPDFPSFKNGMHDLNFGKYFKMCPTGVRLQHFSSWCACWRILRRGGFRNHFVVAKWVYGAAKGHSCAKGWFRSCETPFKMEFRLRNGGFQGVEVPQPFRSCEMSVQGFQMALMC